MKISNLAKSLIILALLMCGVTMYGQEPRMIDEKPPITLNDETETCPEGWEKVRYQTSWSYPTGEIDSFGCPVYHEVVEVRAGCQPIEGYRAPAPQDTIPMQSTTAPAMQAQIDSAFINTGNASNIHVGRDNYAPILLQGGDVYISMGAPQSESDTTDQQQPQDSCGPYWLTRPYLTGLIGIHANQAAYNSPSYGVGAGLEVLRTDSCSEWFTAGRIQYIYFPGGQYLPADCGCDLQQRVNLFGLQGELQLGWSSQDSDVAFYATARSPALWPTDERMVHPVPNHGVYAGISWQPAWFSLSGEIGGWESWGVFATLRVYPFEL